MDIQVGLGNWKELIECCLVDEIDQRVLGKELQARVRVKVSEKWNGEEELQRLNWRN